MKKAGVTDYMKFVKNVLKEMPGMPISFEVFADDFETMEKRGCNIIRLWEKCFFKIPITNSKGESSISIISDLSKKKVNLNVTAIFTVEQAEAVLDVLEDGTENIILVFAGRIADTGVDPKVIMGQVAELCRQKEGTVCLWASCREAFNIMQVERCGADIITVINDLPAKLGNVGKDLGQFSLETVQMFERDGRSVGFSIEDC